MPKGMLRRLPEEIRAWREQEEKGTKRKWKKRTALPIYLVLLMIPFCSCVTRKACEKRFPPIEKDSVRIVRETVTTIRDTTIYITLKGDTVFRSIPMGQGVSKLETPFAISYASVRDGRLNHRLEQRDTAVGVTIKGAVKTTQSTTDRNEVIRKKEYEFTGWQWVQMWMVKVFVLIIVLVILWWLLFKIKV